jgi:hypothetical protein
MDPGISAFTALAGCKILLEGRVLFLRCRLARALRAGVFTRGSISDLLRVVPRGSTISFIAMTPTTPNSISPLTRGGDLLY